MPLGTVAAIAVVCALVLLVVIGRAVPGKRRAKAELQEKSDRLLAEARNRSAELVQEAVLESEARLNGIIESAMDAIITVDE